MRAAQSLTIVAFTLSSACATRPPEMSSRAIPTGATSVAIRRDNASSVFQGNSGLTEPVRMLIRNDADWRRTWAQLVGHISPAPDPPQVDFTKEMVLVAAMGTRPTTGYSIRIARVGSAGGVTYVDVVSERPGARCRMGQMMTAPADVVIVPKIDEPLTFVETDSVKVC